MQHKDSSLVAYIVGVSGRQSNLYVHYSAFKEFLAAVLSIERAPFYRVPLFLEIPRQRSDFYRTCKFLERAKHVYVHLQQADLICNNTSWQPALEGHCEPGT